MAFTTVCWSQEVRSPRTLPFPVYLELGLAPVLNHNDGIAGTAAITALKADKPYGLSLRGRYGSMQPLDIPADFRPGSNLVGGTKNARDRFSTFALSGVWKVYPVANAPLLRIGLEAGPALMRYSKENFTPYNPPPKSTFSLNSPPNYLSSTTVSYQPGVEAVVRAEFSGKYMGFAIGGWAHANSVIRLIGLDLSLQIGRMR